MSAKREKEKAQQIQVFVRMRPINKQERSAHSLNSIDLLSTRDLSVKQQHSKKYSFDRVFGPYVKQIEVYMTVVNPLIAEVLAGYNCTVFAYGQTGTGKTYTMAGGSVFSAGISWQDDEDAGIIPRALAHLFDELRLVTQEYTVRVSYLELYNEELYDLLSDADDVSRIRLFEDQRQKGSVIIQGVEEQTVHSKNEVYKILEKGQEKRRTASTLMNAQSSRSHTVFSITVHTRENNIDGEELVKTGKLNLVDLAGSENISRSGAVDVRAREAGNINQSLLTLGRVIKALVERCPHVPYRESKLTRILQDSLGGRTKTSIIATISPASTCMEETLSTLEYANRARNIINRPEVNQKMSQKLLIGQYADEIERLKKDLAATRSGTAVCLAPDNYQRLITDSAIQREELAEKINFIRNLEQQLKNAEEQKDMLEAEWNRLRFSFDETNRRLYKYHNKLKKTVVEKKEQEYLANCYEQDAESLHKQAEVFLNVTKNSSRNELVLRSKIEALRNHGNMNITTFRSATDSFSTKCKELVDEVSEYSRYCCDSNKYLNDMLRDLHVEQNKNYEHNVDVMKKFLEQANNSTNVFNTEIEENHLKTNNWIVNFIDQFKNHMSTINNCYKQNMEDTHKFIENMLISNQERYGKFNNEIDEKLLEMTSETDNACKSIKIAINDAADDAQQRLDMLIKNLTNNDDHLKSVNQQLNESRHDIISFINSKFDNLEGAVNTGIKLNSNAQENANNVTRGLSEKLSEINDKIEDAENNFRDTSMSFISNIKNYRQEQIVNSATFLDNLHSHQIVKDQFIDHMSQNVISDIESAGCNFTQNNNETQSEFKTLLNSNSETVRTFVEKGLKEAKELSSKFELNIRKMTTQVSEHKETTSEFTTKLPNELHKCEDDLHNCVENELIEVMANGDTPVRLNFNYPNHLKQPSPKERLLSRFRQQFTNDLNISGISLDGDSSHSDDFTPLNPE